MAKKNEYSKLEDKCYLMLPASLFGKSPKDGDKVSVSLKGSITFSKKGSSSAPGGERLYCVVAEEVKTE